MKAIKQKTGYKSNHTFFGMFLYIPLSKPLVKLFLRTPITPNQVSIMTFFISVLAALSFSTGKYLYFVIGVLCYNFAGVLDAVDGRLARLKNMTSKYGHFLDETLDSFSEVVILLSITLSVVNVFGAGINWLIGTLAIISVLMYNITNLETKIQHKKVIKAKSETRYTLMSILPFSRSSKILFISLFMLLNLPYVILWFYAVFGNLFWLSRLFFYRNKMD